jgi:hypothetical protein
MTAPCRFRSDFVVMAHPARRTWVDEYLRAYLPAPLRVVYDRGGGEWDTAARALSLPADGVSWRVIVQDDALLALGFAEAVGLALGHLEPVHPVSFYIGNVPKHEKIGGGVDAALELAESMRASWVEMPGPWWGVAFAVPVDDVPQILERRTRMTETDLRIATFYKLRGVECLYSVPSIADHRRAAENPSLVGSPRDRFARNFIGDRSALELDWRGPVARMHTRFRSVRNGRVKIVRPRDLGYHDDSAVWQRV